MTKPGDRFTRDEIVLLRSQLDVNATAESLSAIFVRAGYERTPLSIIGQLARWIKESNSKAAGSAGRLFKQMNPTLQQQVKEVNTKELEKPQRTFKEWTAEETACFENLIYEGLKSTEELVSRMCGNGYPKRTLGAYEKRLNSHVDTLIDSSPQKEAAKNILRQAIKANARTKTGQISAVNNGTQFVKKTFTKNMLSTLDMFKSAHLGDEHLADLIATIVESYVNN